MPTISFDLANKKFEQCSFAQTIKQSHLINLITIHYLGDFKGRYVNSYSSKIKIDIIILPDQLSLATPRHPMYQNDTKEHIIQLHKV